MLQDCRAGKIDRILVKSISRFARNTVDCIETVRELSLLGIAVEFEKENIDTSAMGDEMLLSMLGAAAQEESLSISQNLQWGIQKRMRKGEYITDSTPFGYRLENERLVIYEPEAAVVREIFALYLAGDGLVTIAQKLTQMGISPSVSNTWHHGAIRYILQNEKYIGDSLFQKSYTTNSLPLKRCLNDGQRPQFYASNTHTAIIDRDTFNRAQQLHEQRIETYAPSQVQQPHIFAKVLFCGHCGATLRSTKRNSGICAWSCRTHHQSKLQCPMKPVCETELHRAFLFMSNKLIFNYRVLLSPMLRDLQAALKKASSAQTDIVDTNREIVELLTQNHALTRLQTKGYIDTATFTQRNNEINLKNCVISLYNISKGDYLDIYSHNATKLLQGIAEKYNFQTWTLCTTSVLFRNSKEISDNAYSIFLEIFSDFSMKLYIPLSVPPTELTDTVVSRIKKALPHLTLDMFTMIDGFLSYCSVQSTLQSAFSIMLENHINTANFIWKTDFRNVKNSFLFFACENKEWINFLSNNTFRFSAKETSEFRKRPLNKITNRKKDIFASCYAFLLLSYAFGYTYDEYLSLYNAAQKMTQNEFGSDCHFTNEEYYERFFNL